MTTTNPQGMLEPVTDAFRAPSSEEAREAHRIQRGLLPARFPKVGNCDVHGSWLPAAAVGGDYYDAIVIDETRIAFSIADVSGKGLPAALLMASIQAALRAVVQTSVDPAEICRRANRLVYASTTPERYVTLFIAVLDTSTGSFEYANAGHVAPVLLANDGSAAQMLEGGCALGFFNDGVWERGTGRLGAGDRLVLFTDGLTEAENEAGEAFGEAGLMQSLFRHRRHRSVEFHHALFEDAIRFSGRLQDDASLLTVTATPHPDQSS
jgi:sigma-B regulation protein RsbU (phosphoserine phosphatase)